MNPEDELTPDEVERAIDWINEKALDPKDACQVCGSDNNTVVNALARVDFEFVSEPGSVPLVVTVCHNCGYIRFFSAVEIGLRSVASRPVDAGEADAATSA